jgi:hypothetical protein
MLAMSRNHNFGPLGSIAAAYTTVSQQLGTIAVDQQKVSGIKVKVRIGTSTVTFSSSLADGLIALLDCVFTLILYGL